jgi:fumarate reductase flavoprotein subunit
MLKKLIFTVFVLAMAPGYAADSGIASLHVAKGLNCAGCHGTDKPEPFAEVGNDKCLQCHGPKERLVNRFAAEYGPRNPHSNHLGDIACNICHKGHEPQSVYCNSCHKDFNFKMK